MKVKVNFKKKFAWSPSNMKEYFTCPLKAHHRYWSLNPPPYVQSPEALEGDKVHKALENAVGKNIPLPKEYEHLQKWVTTMNNLEGQKICEGKVALTKDWKLTDYFAKDVWGRLVVDLIVKDREQISTFDYKTGKSRYVDDDQIELCTIAGSIKFPDATKFKAGYIYTKEDKFTHNAYSIADIPMLKQKFNTKVAQMEESYNNQWFEAKPNFLCKSWCDNKGCQFNGK